MIVVSCLLRPQENPTLPLYKMKQKPSEKELIKRTVSFWRDLEKELMSSLPLVSDCLQNQGGFEDLKLEEKQFSSCSY